MLKSEDLAFRLVVPLTLVFPGSNQDLPGDSFP